ncbi:MAG: hypothetical protein KME38_29030 [Spirirestis rafaelensis WJT71-NPBG6]|jgi:hypothetical protein|nr:hypothetical protein [Spirirestis rafaelensis WJT71-NPBG6]
MNKQEIMVNSARAEVAQSAQTLLNKIDALERLEPLTELQQAVYDRTDLNISDATNVLHFLIEVLEQ